MMTETAGRIPTRNSPTPWGPAQDVYEWAPGILAVSTSSHGGLWVSPERRARMPAALKMPTDFYSGGPWFEEDCEVARVIFAFPDIFPVDYLDNARESLKRHHPEVLAAYDSWKIRTTEAAA